MGRAVECPLCRCCDLHYEEVRYQGDLFSRFPTLTIETLIALVCRRCNHVQLIRPVDEPGMQFQRN